MRDRLDAFIRNADTVHRTEPWVVLSNLIDNDGRPYDGAKNAVVMFLANIQNETVISTYNRNVPVAGDQYAVVSPPLYIDLFLLFYANFENQSYAEGLGVISRVISFFQQNLWFTPQTLPGLHPDIDKLTFEFTNLDTTGLNYLMGLMGGKYLPSVFYKVRMIPFRSEAMQASVPAAKGIEASGETEDPSE